MTTDPTPSAEPVHVAAVQAAPVYDDLEAGLDKAERLIDEAADRGARLVAFGETWLPGYPAWLDHCPGACLWDHAPTKAVYARLVEHSVEVPGPATERLGAVAARRAVALVMSVSERVPQGRGRGTLYNTLLTFDEAGALVNVHRKLVPTYTERLIWGPGDGGGLHAVESGGWRVGGLTCWEHWMPLARQALHDSGEDVHVAVWPRVADIQSLASRHYALEGRCYVLAIGTIARVADMPPEFSVPDRHAGDLLLDGGSVIYGPDGACVAGPVHGDETILVADLDLRRIKEESMTLDVGGHYARPDVFKFRVRRRRSRQ